ncbi:MAG: hypothetical protein A2089_00590 [Elusimicrobia bacterium GWD2_63_28]|nr:MAG: hypothetical protein A2089_00590 [Elusimicrobia bacterium GWD2_63_28]
MNVSGVYANGVTSHAVAGERVIDTLESRDLAKILRDNEIEFHNGIFWPDASNEEFEEQGDRNSHGWTEKTKTKEQIGYNSTMQDAIRRHCGKAGDPFIKVCQEAIAFYMGTLTHMVVDGPWHKQFIDNTTKDECKAAELTGADNTDRRHDIADENIDLCLERRLRGVPGNIAQPVYAKASYHKKIGCVDEGTFDGLDGICYKCDEDYKHYGGYGVNDERVCQKPRTYGGKAEQSCAKTGGFGPCLTNGKCYKCESGWTHDPGQTACSKEVCYKQHRKKAEKANRHGCEDGQFSHLRNGVQECWSCPKDYNRTGHDIKDAKACALPMQLPCDKLELPSWAKRPKVGAGPSDTAVDFLVLAYSTAAVKDGQSKPRKEWIKNNLDKFRVKYRDEGFGAAASGVKAFGDKCDWIYEHAFSGKGGISDGIGEAKKLLDAIWPRVKARKEITVLRVSTYRYAAYEDGVLIYETKDRF